MQYWFEFVWTIKKNQNNVQSLYSIRFITLHLHPIDKKLWLKRQSIKYIYCLLLNYIGTSQTSTRKNNRMLLPVTLNVASSES